MTVFLKFQLINPQTGKPEDEAYVDAELISSWQSMKTKHEKPCVLMNIKSGMGFAYQVNETFDEFSARVLAAKALSPKEAQLLMEKQAALHEELAEGQKLGEHKSPLAI